MFSVVIPSRNSSAYIEHALNSIVNQDTDLPIEVIIIDDNSEDFLLLDEVVNNYSEILDLTLISVNIKTNASYCRNVGIKKAKYDLICLLDADDYWSTNKLSSGYKILKNSLGRVVVYGVLHRGTREDYTNERYDILPKRDIGSQERLSDYIFIHDGVIQTSSIIYRRSDFIDILFNENLERHQDYDFCFKLEASGAIFLLDRNSITNWVILDPNVTAVKKGATLSFCLSWLESNMEYITPKSMSAYLIKVAMLVSIREGVFYKWILYMLKERRLDLFTLNQLRFIFIKLLRKKIKRYYL